MGKHEIEKAGVGLGAGRGQGSLTQWAEWALRKLALGVSRGLESCPAEVGVDLQSRGMILKSHAHDPGDTY